MNSLRRRSERVLSLLALFVVCTQASGQGTVDLTDDAYVDSSSPTAVHDTTELRVGRSPSGPAPPYRSFIRFDLGAIPGDATVSSAILTLNLQGFVGSATAFIELRRVLGTWTENALTWNNQPGASSPLVTTPVGSAVGANFQWPITALVQGWVAGQFPNHGVALRVVDEANATNSRAFASREHTNALLRPKLEVTYTVPPDIDVVPTELAFGDQQVGTSSAWQSFTIWNRGGSNLRVDQVASSNGEFAISFPGSLPAFLGPDGGMTVQVRFTPASAGDKSGNITIASTDPDEATRIVSCSGRGVSAPTPPDIDIVPTALAFGDQQVGTSSGWQNFTIWNRGGSNLRVDQVTSSNSEFAISLPGSLPAFLGPDGGMTVQVRFTPASAGDKSGNITIASTDPDEATRIVSCSGRGVSAPAPPDIDLTPAVLVFGNQPLGTTSAIQIVTLWNLGGSALRVSAVASSGNEWMLSALPGLPAIVEPSDSVSFQVRFAPSAVGTRNGTITISSDDPDESTRTLPCAGAGVSTPVPPDIDVVPTSLIFGNQPLGTTSTPQTVTILNRGGSVLRVSDIVSSSSEFVLNLVPGLPAIVEPSDSVSFQVRFAPLTEGDKNAILAIHSDDVRDPRLEIPVMGTGALGSSLVSEGSDWKYLDDGSNQGTSWRNVDFDDSGWALGPAQLGFGDGDEATVVRGNRADGSRIITTYFRHQFVVCDPRCFTNLAFSVVRDDGAVVYLNGRELFRMNMPGGNVSFDTRASLPMGDPDENNWFDTYVANVPGLLLAGPNLLAVEVHQINTNSSDLSFNLRLEGQGQCPPLPVVTVTPLSLHFADRTVNTVSPPKTVTVRNDGSTTLTVQSITTDSPEFPLSTLPNLPASVAPGASVSFGVRFAPLTAGAKVGKVRIQRDNPCAPPFEITCDGRSNVGPQNEWPPVIEYASYSFGPTATGDVSSAQMVFALNNTTQSFRITGIQSLPSASPFKILNRVPSLPAAVPPGGRLRLFDVHFAPSELGSFTETLQVTTDVAALNPVIARFTGRSRHLSLPDFYTDPRALRVEFDRLKYSAGDPIWLRLEAAEPAPMEALVFLVSPAQDDLEAIYLDRGGGGDGSAYRQVQRVSVADTSQGHFDGTLAAKPGDFIFAFVNGANSGRPAADYAFISGGAPQGLFTLATDPNLIPQPASVPGRPGERPRGLAAITDSSGYPGVFGDDQLIIEPRDLAELHDFLRRYDGQIVDDGRRSKHPTVPLKHHYYLVRVNLDRADDADFAFMGELAGMRGPLRTSSDATRKLYSILIQEQLESRRVTLNPRVEYFSQPATVEGAGLLDGSTDAFALPYVQSCVQKINRAWSYVALQDRDRASGVNVRLAIIDDGFCLNADLPMAADIGHDVMEDDGDPTGPRVTTFGAAWHGTSVASAAASLHNNGLGSAGAGGQVVELMFYRLGNWGHVFDVGTAIELAVNDGAQVINMSFGLPCRVFGGPTFCEIDQLDYWLGFLFGCPLINAHLIAAQDLLITFLPGRITCEELFLTMAAARSRMLAGVEDALDAGVCLVASAGNDMGPVPDSDIEDFDIIPASFDGVIAVGAMDTNLVNTEFFGNRVDVWTMIPVRVFGQEADDDSCDDPPGIHDFGQTSGGSGFVAGIVCLMLAVNPNLTPAEIRGEMRNLLDLSPNNRVQRPLDAYRLVRNAGLLAGLPDLQLRSPSLGFDEDVPAGLRCPGLIGLWPPASRANDDTLPAANPLQLGANEFLDCAVHPFRSPAGIETDLYMFDVPAFEADNVTYDVEIQTVYPTAAGDVLPHPDAIILDGIDGFPDHSSATYRRSGLFWRDDVFFSVQGNDLLVANRDNVYLLSASLTRRAIQPDRYDRAPLGDPPNDTFANATPLSNAPGGDEWDYSDDALQSVWQMRVRGLNFHTPTDVDYFCVDLPDEALNDCLAVNTDCPFDAVRAQSSGRLTIRVPGARAIIKLDSAGRELSRDEAYLEYNCQETGDRAYFAVIGSPEVSLDYEIRIAYTLPEAGSAFRFGELCDAWKLVPLPPDPRPGGFDVINPGTGEAQEFWLGIDCNPIVCDPPLHDYLVFNWAETRALELEFQHAATAQFEFELLDHRLNLMARGAPLVAPGASSLTSTQRLQYPSLPTGLYLIHVAGSQFESPYTVRFLTPGASALRIDRATVRRDGTHFQFSWLAEPGRAYQVQFKERFTDAPWSNLGSAIIASGPTASVADPAMGQSSRFYRVLRLQ